MCVCIIVHKCCTQQHSSDNFPSYPQDNHHNDIYRRAGGVTGKVSRLKKPTL